jgi:hypothetical protein
MRGQLSLAVRRTQPLLANWFIITASQLFDILKSLVYCFSDGAHISSGAEEQLLREPYGFVIRGPGVRRDDHLFAAPNIDSR